MKVFLSWSGEQSHKIACAFRDWLPSVIQSIEHYVSSEDIDKGARWSTDIAKELEESSFGIICVTRENLEAPWVHFEAGALSKSLEKANVCPFLVDIKRSEVHGPLLQFQSAIFTKEEVKKLVESINNRLEEKERLKTAQLEKAFEIWWPELKKTLDEIVKAESKGLSTREKPRDGKSDILEQVLDLLRQQQRVLNDPETLLPAPYLMTAFRRVEMGNVNPRALRDLQDKILQLEANVGQLAETHPEVPLAEVHGRILEIRDIFRYIRDRLRSGPHRRDFWRSRNIRNLEEHDKDANE